MPLLDLWHSARETVESMPLNQLLANAGDGRLKDGSDASTEFRTFIKKVPSRLLEEYCDFALSCAIQDGGLALQDLVNEVGRRLEFSVVFGRYRGVSNTEEIGFDGLWTDPNGDAIVVEVKTTDAYRISLDTVAKYRENILESGKVTGSVSILYVVGRSDTGELEAQIRGSRYAWDVRLISIDALLKLLQIKESTEEEQTLSKIRKCLEPVEYTRIDSIVDLIFTATKDAEFAQTDDPDPRIEEKPEQAPRRQEQTPRAVIEERRSELVRAVSRDSNTSLVAKRKALFWSDDEKFRICCVVSKRYEQGTRTYWYALHEPWLDFLAAGDQSFYVAGCVDQRIGFSLPYSLLSELIPKLNATTLPDKRYWHVQIKESARDKHDLIVHGGELIPINEFRFEFSTTSALAT
jgi:hypothetical protein